MPSEVSTLTLTEIYEKLLEAYGPQNWWPGETRFEVMVGAILTQSTAWTNVEMAIDNLKKASILSPFGLRSISLGILAKLVYPSGYYNAKAKKLKALAEYVGERFNDDFNMMRIQDTFILRSELLEVHGIGYETADAILLYALDKPVFVIDAFTRRILNRLGMKPDNESYVAYQKLFTGHLLQDKEIFGEYHALIVRHAKEVCNKLPKCRQCFLVNLCPTGRNSIRN